LKKKQVCPVEWDSETTKGIREEKSKRKSTRIILEKNWNGIGKRKKVKKKVKSWGPQKRGGEWVVRSWE